MSSDNFDLCTKAALAKRVGFRCSNPNCKKLTSSPGLEATESINIFLAAHISVVFSHGSESDSELTSKQMEVIDNGIWFCRNCKNLIDNDLGQYFRAILFEWKWLAGKKLRLFIPNIYYRDIVIEGINK